MVEKWLLQVEDVMISSLRKVITDSVAAYKTTHRKRWVVEWPGQVVLCVSNVYWTSEVTDAMKTDGGLKVISFVKSIIKHKTKDIEDWKKNTPEFYILRICHLRFKNNHG